MKSASSSSDSRNSRSRRGARAALAALTALLALGAAARANADGGAAGKTARPVARFALVVGNNTPPHAGLSILRYADDDAVRWASLFETLGGNVELLTTFDAETTRLVGPSPPAHHAATRVELEGAMSRLVAGMKSARERGSRIAFFFVYAGHGDTDKREGYVSLEDGPFHRSDLEDAILALSIADTNHVIVDACRSAYLAYDRGPGGSRRPWTDPYFGAGTMARFRNTGFLLANSTGGPSHEWEEFQAGIFSHELRSGLLGGADADGDQRITYRELAAFVRVANESVRNEKYRPSMLAIPPRDGNEVVVDFSGATGGRVRFGGRTGRHVVEDQFGVRWADVHPGPKQDLTLLLPKGATPRLFVRTPEDEVEFTISRDADVTLAALTPTKSTVSRRGALNEAFAALFNAPFDASVLTPSLVLVPDDEPAGLDLTARPSSPEGRRRFRVAELSLAAGSVLAFGASAYLYKDTTDLVAAPPPGNGADRANLNADIQSGNRWTVATAITGGLLALSAVALYLWERRAADAAP